MGLNKINSIFPTGKEFNVNFDWIDVASATGYLNYDLFTTLDSGGTNRLLIETSTSSGLSSISGYSAGWAPVSLNTGSIMNTNVLTKRLDLDYDSTEFQLPRIVRGKAYFRFFVHTGRNAGTDVQVYAKIRLRKWDGTTETEIADVTSPTLVWTSDQTIPVSLSVDVPQTHFKKGEQLRITIEGWVKSGATGWGYVSLTGDPADLTTTDGGFITFAAGETRILCAIPFKIEV